MHIYSTYCGVHTGMFILVPSNEEIKSLPPGRFERNLRLVIFKVISVIDGCGISSEVVQQGPVSLTFFHCNSNSMEILFHSHLGSNTVIDTKFCTWHDSCRDLMASNGVMARRSFHQIWIVDKKTLVKRAPEMNVTEPYWWLGNIGLGNGLVKQAITWANSNLVLYRHMVSLGHNDICNRFRPICLFVLCLGFVILTISFK